jgi:hypothetical protein
LQPIVTIWPFDLNKGSTDTKLSLKLSTNKQACSSINETFSLRVTRSFFCLFGSNEKLKSIFDINVSTLESSDFKLDHHKAQLRRLSILYCQIAARSKRVPTWSSCPVDYKETHTVDRTGTRGVLALLFPFTGNTSSCSRVPVYREHVEFLPSWGAKYIL